MFDPPPSKHQDCPSGTGYEGNNSLETEIGPSYYQSAIGKRQIRRALQSTAQEYRVQRQGMVAVPLA
jgi:hypothetical protein